MITLIFLLGALVAYFILTTVLQAVRPGLRSIPGPFIAKFTDAWRAYQSRKGMANVVLPRLRQQYGDVIRIGPNVVYVSEQGIGERLMNHKANYPKSDSMKVWQTAREGKIIPGIATTQDREVHGQLKRPIAGIYANSNVLQFEPNVQDTNKYLLKRFDEEFISKNCACDIDNWVQYYAFDIVGQITLSKRLGFLEQGHDIDGMLASLNEEFAYRGWVQNMPWLEKFYRKNPLYLWLFKPTQRFMAHAMKLTMQRKAENAAMKKGEDRFSDGESHGKVDFMQRFLEAQQQHPNIVTDTILNGYVMTNFLAGSDTTAVTMRTIIYYILRTPGVLSTLRAELDSHLKDPSDYPVSYKVAVSMPYLMATILEALRIHPIGAITFERVLPAEGLTLQSGIKLPGGTIVATSPWTTNFEGSCYDDDVDPSREFRPQRWLQRKTETEEQFSKRLAELKKHDLSFSTGPRGCLGKWIALLEIYTIVPTMFGLFDFEFAHPEQPWSVDSRFFTRQYDMDVRIKWRDGVDRGNYV